MVLPREVFVREHACTLRAFVGARVPAVDVEDVLQTTAASLALRVRNDVA